MIRSFRRPSRNRRSSGRTTHLRSTQRKKFPIRFSAARRFQLSKSHASSFRPAASVIQKAWRLTTIRPACQTSILRAASICPQVPATETAQAAQKVREELSPALVSRSEEHTSELQSPVHL